MAFSDKDVEVLDMEENSISMRKINSSVSKELSKDPNYN